jgi:hypothetical protein
VRSLIILALLCRTVHAEPVDKSKDAAWLLVGGSLAFVTTGAVLAYSADSSEKDLEDLYLTTDGSPATYDAKTQARYETLVDEGRRFEHLSWASFGIAGGMAIGASILFWRASGQEDTVTPIVTPTSAGVALKF